MGKTEGLEKHIYDISVSNQTQLFSNITKEISEYAGRTLKESQDIRLAIEKIEDVTFDVPTKRTVTTALDTNTINIIYKTEIDAYIKRENVYWQNKSLMYAIVFG